MIGFLVIFSLLTMRWRSCPGGFLLHRNELTQISGLESPLKSVDDLVRAFPIKLSEGPSDTRVPRVIMQTGSSRQIPLRFYEATRNLLRASGSFGYRFYSDAEAEAYLRNNCGGIPGLIRAYESLIPGALRSDLFRYCYLYHDGGCYLDMGMNVDLDRGPLLSLESVLDSARRKDVHVIVPEDSGFGFLYNGVIFAIPKHPVFMHAMTIAADRIQRRFYTNEDYGALIVTGPQLLRDAVLHYADGENVDIEEVQKIGFRSRRVNRGEIKKDIAVVEYYRSLHCLSGIITVGRELIEEKPPQIFSTRWNLLFTKTFDYYSDSKTFFRQEHYGVLWSKGPDHVYRERNASR
jgi:mannosyltransferase OCH1-like enzyme